LKAIVVAVLLIILAVLFGKEFFVALGIATYVLLLYLVYKMIVFHGRVLKAGRSAEHYSEELVNELKALVKVIHKLKVRKR
jgi:uncharacterized protein (DUF58 family)